MPLTTVCPLLIQGRTAQAYTFVQLYECPVVQEFSAWENPAMSDFDTLHQDLLAAFESQVKLNKAQQRLDAVTNEQIERLWTDNAALRDELHAVANRVEGLVRAVTSNPADVAAKIVNDANRSTLREVTNDD